MTRAELIERIAIRNRISKATVATVIYDFLDQIKNSLIIGGDVQLPGFGKFSVRKRAARPGRNPRTGEPIEIPASKSPCFQAGRALKAAVKS